MKRIQKFLGILTAAAFMMGTVPMTVLGSGMMGDLDADGEISYMDMAILLSIISTLGADGTMEDTGFENIDETLADVNENGQLDVDDLRQMHDYISLTNAGLSAEFEVRDPYHSDEVRTVSLPDTITVTPDELEASSYEVTVEITLDFDGATEFGIAVDDRCIIMDAVGDGSTVIGSWHTLDFDANLIWYSLPNSQEGNTISLVLSLPEDSLPGDFYHIDFVQENTRTAQAADSYGTIYDLTGYSTSIDVEWGEIQEEQPFTYEIKGGYVEITGCHDEATEVVIPAEIEGLPVRSIGSQAFYYCKELTSLTLPDTLTSISYGAFSNCSGLTSLTIPDSVTKIGGSAFAGCSGLTSLQLPDGITTIEAGTFSGCSGLTSMIIPDGVTSIGATAFSSCSNLASIEIPASVKDIGTYAFWYCTALTDIVLPESLTSISSFTFFECNNLTSITIPNTVTSIDYNAFDRCTSLSDVYYGGTEAQWNTVTINLPNDYLLNATMHFLGDTGAEENVPGDANHDAKVTIVDVIYVNKAIMGAETLSDTQRSSVDCDQDGKVTAADSLMILKSLVYLVTLA